MALVYRHIRLDSNQPFYIGIGQDEKRAYSKKDRNKHWKGVVNKHGYKVQIMLDDLTWEEACEKEREFIQLYGRADLGLGTLVNMTDGGEGTVGIIRNEETKTKMSVWQKGKPKSKEHNLKNSLAKIGILKSEETKANMRAGAKRRPKRPQTAEAKEKQKDIQQVTWSNSELREKQSAIMKAWWAERKLKTN